MQKYYTTHNKKLNEDLIFEHKLKDSSSAYDKEIGIYDIETYDISVLRNLDESTPSNIKFEQIGLIEYTIYVGNENMSTGGYFYRVNIKPEYQRKGIFKQLFGLAQNHMLELGAVSYNFFIGKDSECLTEEQISAGVDIKCLQTDTLSEIYSKLGVKKVKDNYRERYKYLSPKDYVPLAKLELEEVTPEAIFPANPYQTSEPQSLTPPTLMAHLILKIKHILHFSFNRRCI